MEMAIRDGYGNGLAKIGDNKDVIVLDADMPDSTKSSVFAKKYPERFFNMGIAEADMVCTAAGLATCDKTAFASTFACFLTGRAFDQILVSVAYPKLNVKLVGSHAGIATGEDGPTAQAITDISLMRTLPNMRIVVPADAVEAEKATIAMYENKGPFYMRTARPKTPVLFDENHEFELGRPVILRDGDDVSILACGLLVNEALRASEILKNDGIDAGVVNMHTIKPMDRNAVVKIAKRCGNIVTCEDHSVIGGLGSAVAEVLSSDYPAKMAMIGINDRFAESGTYKELYKIYGLDDNGIAKKVKEMV